MQPRLSYRCFAGLSFALLQYTRTPSSQTYTPWCVCFTRTLRVRSQTAMTARSSNTGLRQRRQRSQKQRQLSRLQSQDSLFLQVTAATCWPAADPADSAAAADTQTGLCSHSLCLHSVRPVLIAAAKAALAKAPGVAACEAATACSMTAGAKQAIIHGCIAVLPGSGAGGSTGCCMRLDIGGVHWGWSALYSNMQSWRFSHVTATAAAAAACAVWPLCQSATLAAAVCMSSWWGFAEAGGACWVPCGMDMVFHVEEYISMHACAHCYQHCRLWPLAL